MTWPADTSPLWSIAQSTLRVVVIVGGLLCFYASGMELPDLKLLAAFLLAEPLIAKVKPKPEV